jgi:hypothetical protein
MKINVVSGIRTRDPNNQAAAGLRLTPHGQQDQLTCCLLLPNKYVVEFGGTLIVSN